MVAKLNKIISNFKSLSHILVLSRIEITLVNDKKTNTHETREGYMIESQQCMN